MHKKYPNLAVFWYWILFVYLIIQTVTYKQFLHLKGQMSLYIYITNLPCRQNPTSHSIEGLLHRSSSIRSATALLTVYLRRETHLHIVIFLLFWFTWRDTFTYCHIIVVLICIERHFYILSYYCCSDLHQETHLHIVISLLFWFA